METFATAAEFSIVGERDDEYLLSFLVPERQISGFEVPSYMSQYFKANTDFKWNIYLSVGR